MENGTSPEELNTADVKTFFLFCSPLTFLEENRTSADVKTFFFALRIRERLNFGSYKSPGNWK